MELKMNKFYNESYKPLINDEEVIYYDGLNYILSYEATDIEKNINVNISEHFIQHLNKFINILTIIIIIIYFIVYMFFLKIIN